MGHFSEVNLTRVQFCFNGERENMNVTNDFLSTIIVCIKYSLNDLGGNNEGIL